MGGRGASSGISDDGKKYGSQYETIFKSGNIKFVTQKPNSSEALLETRTRGRIYVLVGKNGLKSIIYFDRNLKRNKRIDLDHFHHGMKPHTQHGYYDNEYDIQNGIRAGATSLTNEERKMVERVLKLWHNYTKVHTVV